MKTFIGSLASANAPLRRLVGDWRTMTLEQSVERSVSAFRDLHRRGLVGPDGLEVSEAGIRGSA